MRNGLVVAVLLSATPIAAAPPLAAFGQLPSIGDFELSPDGSRYGVVTGGETGRQVQIRATANNKLIAVFKADRSKVRALQWAGPDHLLVVSSVTAAAIGVTGPKREWSMLSAYSVKADRWRRLLDGQDKTMNVVTGPVTALMIGGEPVVIATGVYFPDRQSVQALFRINLEDYRTRRIETGSADTLEWLVDDTGRAVARADYEQRTGRWSLSVRGSGAWQRGYSEVAPLDAPDLVAFASSKTALVTRSVDGVRGMYEASLADGTLTPRPDLMAASVVIDPVTRAVIGTRRPEMERTRYTFLDPKDQRAWTGIERAFPKSEVRLASWSDDRMKIVVAVEGATTGAAYYLVDRTTRTAEPLGNRYADIFAEDVAPRTAMAYRSADGLTIPAYLTLPKGRVATRLPLVVLAHGGPAARDDPGFDWWAQALASRGYAVLQPQFRGSEGFGERHLVAGYGEWGRKMQTDLSDGVRALARAGTIDPARVCIAGGSYGGYAALAGAALDPGVYRCAVSLAGPSDLRRMLSWEVTQRGSPNHGALRYWARFMGAASPADRRLDAISPVEHAGAVKVPVQLIHGVDDTVVPYFQSEIMARALRKSGSPVELVPLKGEDHWLSRSTTRTEMLTAMVGFIERVNPPGEAAVAAGR